MSTATAPTQSAPVSDKATRFVGRMTLEQYRAFEQRDPNNQRYELIDGKVFRVAGASPEHNRISRNMLRELEDFCERENVFCEAFSSDQKVFVPLEKYVYPDVCLVCGEAQFDFADALRNPCAIVEVLSPSTANSDRSDKFRAYQKIESLRHYILIEQDCISVTHYERLSIGIWAIVGDFINQEDNMTIQVEGANIVVPLSRIYRRVDFPVEVDIPAD